MNESSTPVLSARDAASDPRSGPWDRFYAHCFQIINQCPFVRRLDATDREDCVQEVMIEVVRKLGQASPTDGMGWMTGWVKVVARNIAINFARRRMRRPVVYFEDGAGAAVEQRVAAGQGLNEQDSLSLLWDALLALDEEVTMSSYVIFYLRTIEDWTLAEIAEVFKITPEQVKFRCHRVKKRFGKILKSRSDLLPASGGARVGAEGNLDGGE